MRTLLIADELDVLDLTREREVADLADERVAGAAGRTVTLGLVCTGGLPPPPPVWTAFCEDATEEEDVEDVSGFPSKNDIS